MSANFYKSSTVYLTHASQNLTLAAANLEKFVAFLQSDYQLLMESDNDSFGSLVAQKRSRISKMPFKWSSDAI